MTSPYILISIMLFSYSIIGYGIKNKSYIFSFLLIFSPLMISFINLSDNLIYMTYFEIIQKGYEISTYRFEPVFYYLNYIFSFFSNYSFLRAFLIGSGLSIKFLLFKKFGENIPLILLFYFALQFYVDSYLLRLTFAISFFLIACLKRFENKNIYSVIFMILAINSHRSAFALVPFLILQNFYISISTILISSISIFLIFNLTDITIFLTNNLEKLIVPVIRLSGVSSEETLDYYLTYLSGISDTNSLISGAYILYFVIFIIYSLINNGKIDNPERKKINLISNGMLNSLIFLLAFRLPVMEKIARYTYIFFPLAIGQIISKINNKYKYYSILLISLVLLIGAFIVDTGPFQRL